MADNRRQLHINVNFQGAGSHPGAWRSPEGRPLAAIDIAHFREVARIAERGLLDAVFLASNLAIPVDTRLAPLFVLDPIVAVSAMAVATKNVGFIFTASSTFYQPYNLARSVLSLDHASGGRVGLNIVTTHEDRAARNFGLPHLPTPEERYAIASDFVDVVLKLWDSWEDEALVGDSDTGVWADSNRVHTFNHEGPHFSVAGPMQIPRSPQGRPVLVQAGSSPQGRDFASHYAEVVFTAQQVLEGAQAYYADIKNRAKAYGRDPDRVVVLPGLSLIIGGTAEEAWKRKEELDEIAGGTGSSLEAFAGRLGLEPSDLDAERPVPEHLLEQILAGKIRPRPGTPQGFADAAMALAKDRTLTVREIVARWSGAGHRRVIGAPEQIADTIEEWFHARGADGFNINCDVFPSGLEAFVDNVVPVLQRRGLYRTEYQGSTLREHYGLERPANLFRKQNEPLVAA
jgi:FMN-dependent oxidoreductase (nitrilotriacetate monooxygenase family)